MVFWVFTGDGSGSVSWGVAGCGSVSIISKPLSSLSSESASALYRLGLGGSLAFAWKFADTMLPCSALVALSVSLSMIGTSDSSRTGSSMMAAAAAVSSCWGTPVSKPTIDMIAASTSDSGTLPPVLGLCLTSVSLLFSLLSSFSTVGTSTGRLAPEAGAGASMILSSILTAFSVSSSLLADSSLSPFLHSFSRLDALSNLSGMVFPPAG